MNTKRMSITILLALTGILMASVGPWTNETAYAGDEAGYCAPPIARLIAGNIGRFLVLRSELNVTPDQKRRIADIVRKRSNEIKPVAQKILEKKTALREAVLADQPDERAIRSASDGLAKAIGDAAVVASLVVGEAKKVLTPEQIERIRTFRANCDKAELGWVQQIGNFSGTR
jgi:Spy/CpxP family protein refolding chaperone